jgi:hypothetical protein
MSTTSAQIDVKSSNGSESLRLIAQSGDGKWRELGTSANRSDGASELALAMEAAEARLESIWIREVVAAEEMGNEYLKSAVRGVGERAITAEALRTMLLLAGTEDDRRTLKRSLKEHGEFTVPATRSTTISESSRELYTYKCEKYRKRWAALRALIERWAAGECGAATDALVMMFGDSAPYVGCAAKLDAVNVGGAIRRETFGGVSVNCVNGRCTRITLQEADAKRIIQDFRTALFRRTARAAGIAWGRSSLPIIDLALVDTDTAERRIGNGVDTSDDDNDRQA